MLGGFIMLETLLALTFFSLMLSTIRRLQEQSLNAYNLNQSKFNRQDLQIENCKIIEWNIYQMIVCDEQASTHKIYIFN